MNYGKYVLYGLGHGAGNPDSIMGIFDTLRAAKMKSPYCGIKLTRILLDGEEVFSYVRRAPRKKNIVADAE